MGVCQSTKYPPATATIAAALARIAPAGGKAECGIVPATVPFAHRGVEQVVCRRSCDEASHRRSVDGVMRTTPFVGHASA